jgi:hypothetical protein
MSNLYQITAFGEQTPDFFVRIAGHDRESERWGCLSELGRLVQDRIKMPKMMAVAES